MNVISTRQLTKCYSKTTASVRCRIPALLRRPARPRGPGEATRLAKRLDLDLDRRAGELSKGNRQKLGIVQLSRTGPTS